MIIQPSKRHPGRTARKIGRIFCYFLSSLRSHIASSPFVEDQAVILPNFHQFAISRVFRASADSCRYWFPAVPVRESLSSYGGSHRPASRLPELQGILCSRSWSRRRLQPCYCSFQVWIAGLDVRRNCLELCTLSWSRMHGACRLVILGAGPRFHHGVLKGVMCDSTNHSGRISSYWLGAEDPGCVGHDVFCCHRRAEPRARCFQGGCDTPKSGKKSLQWLLVVGDCASGVEHHVVGCSGSHRCSSAHETCRQYRKRVLA